MKITQQVPFWSVLLFVACFAGHVDQQHTANYNQVERSENSESDNILFLQTSSSVAPGCPDNVAEAAETFWKDYFLKECRKEWDDLTSDIMDDIKNPSSYIPLSTDEDKPGCRLESFIANHGTLVFEVGKKTGFHQMQKDGEIVEKDACNLFETVDIPTLLDLSSDKVEEMLDEVKKVFVLECKGKGMTKDDLGLGTDLSMKPIIAKRGDTLSDGSTMLTVHLPLTASSSSTEDFKVVFSETDLTEEEEILEKTKMQESQVQEDFIKREGNETDDTNFIQRRIKVASPEDRGSGDETLDESTNVENYEHDPPGGSGDTLADVVGKLTILDEQISPRLCSICGACTGDELSGLLEDEDEEGKIKERESRYPELKPAVLLKVEIPHAGSKEEHMPPASPGRVVTKGSYRKTASPGMGDTFHSTIMPKRTAEDHKEIWARSRALIQTLKAENVTVPESYHYYDSPETAGCFQPAYDQGKCGSCWSFASLGALEKQICKRARSTVVASLSREMLVRCSEQNNACGGGNADKAYEDLMEIGGVFSTDCLPYQGEGSKHCPAFSYSWFGQGSVGKTGKFTRIDQELQKSCKDHTRYSNRPPIGKEWDLPFRMLYQERFGKDPDLGQAKLQSYRRNFAKARSRDRVPSWWLYGEAAMKAAIVKYGSIYASFQVRSDFKGRACKDGCWPPGTVYGEEALFIPATCGCPKGHAVHIIGYGEDIQETGLKVPYWLIENSWGTDTHGDVYGEDSVADVKGFGKDPFTELHPLGIEEDCLLGGWVTSSLPMVGGCGGNDKLNIREKPKPGEEPDGMVFSLEVNGQHAGQWPVGANKAVQILKNITYKPGVNNYTMSIYSKNHPKQQGAFDIESYGMKAMSLRCRGKGFRYSFTQNDTKATLSWGRKTRKQLKAEADALIPTNKDPEYLYGGCPEPCRTGRYSWAKPCLGILATWGSCYTDSWAKTSSYMKTRTRANCEKCDQNAFKLKQKAFAVKNLDNATYLKWFTLVEQSWDAPDEPGWMRMNVGNCMVETAGWVKNAMLSATYTFTMPEQTFCDERHSAPYAKGKFVHAPGYMVDGAKKTQRCPAPLLGTVTLSCVKGALSAIENNCHRRPTAPGMESGGYYKTVRGVNYHGIEDGAAFAIAEMNRFESHCPTYSWTRWSECNTSYPCERGMQNRTRDPIGISKSDPNCAEMLFYEERPCVGPGFCNQVLTRFVAGGPKDIEPFLGAYKKQSTTIKSDKYATAGAHMLPTSTPTCADAKYWCKITTGTEKCGMYFEGHFQVKKDAEYLLSYEVSSGEGILEFNTLGEGNELTAQYQVRAGQAISMYEWQDLGFHHRRRRTDTKPWAAIGTLAMKKGTYYARMTRTGWSSCPTFNLRLEMTTAIYKAPMLLGNDTIASKITGKHGGSQLKTVSWTRDIGYSRRRRGVGWGSTMQTGKTNELRFGSVYGTWKEKTWPINKLTWTAEEIYNLAQINPLNLPGTVKKWEAFEILFRSTVVLPEAGEYLFKYQVDASYKKQPWIEANSRRRYLQFKMRVGGSNKNSIHFNSWQASAVKSITYKATEAGTVKLEIAQSSYYGTSDYRMVLPNKMQVEVKKKDLLHGETLEFGSQTKYMSDLTAIRGDQLVRIDWPERDDPLSSELKTQTFQALYPHDLLIGNENVLAFAALAEVVIDAGACVSLEAWATPKTSNVWGVGMNLCDVDGANQYLEMVKYTPPTTNNSNVSMERIGWVHIGFTQPTHMKIMRDPNDLQKFEFSYRPDNRLWFAKPFDSISGTGITGKVEVGVSMNSGEAYRYAEFYNISIEDCPNSCFETKAGVKKQLYCGNVTTPCGNMLSCPSSCGGTNLCKDQQCMDCEALVLTPAQKQWECGDVKQMCTNIKGQKVQVITAVGTVPSAPSDYHFCVENKWSCTSKSKWAFLAEGLECGAVKDETTCGAELKLFDCPMTNDQCISHKCKCTPSTFSKDFNCGAEADGCGLEVYFGNPNGTCTKAGDRCSNNICCTPKTKLDFPSSYECGVASDGCGASVAFSKAPPESFMVKPPESTSVNSHSGQWGIEFTTKSAGTVGALGRGLQSGTTKLKETSKVSLWDVTTKKELASVDVGPDAEVDKGYAWVNLEQPVNLLGSRKYRLVQRVWNGMKDKFSGKYVSSWYRNSYQNTDYGSYNSLVTSSQSSSYPHSSYHRRRSGSGFGIVNVAFVANQGCGGGDWTCHSNHSCTKPPPSPLGSFEVKTGSCKLTDAGTCVTSPNYPSLYGKSQTCKIMTPKGGYLKSVYFQVENWFDKLYIGSKYYSGYKGPKLTLSKSLVMNWKADYIVQKKGWKICVSNKPSLLQENETMAEVETDDGMDDLDEPSEEERAQAIARLDDLEDISEEERAEAIAKYTKQSTKEEKKDEVPANDEIA